MGDIKYSSKLKLAHSYIKVLQNNHFGNHRVSKTKRDANF